MMMMRTHRLYQAIIIYVLYFIHVKTLRRLFAGDYAVQYRYRLPFYTSCSFYSRTNEKWEAHCAHTLHPSNKRLYVNIVNYFMLWDFRRAMKIVLRVLSLEQTWIIQKL